MWERERNSEDDIYLVYKETGAKDTKASENKDHQYLPKPTFNPVSKTNATTADNQQGQINDAQSTQNNNREKRRAKTQAEVANWKDTITLEAATCKTNNCSKSSQ